MLKKPGKSKQPMLSLRHNLRRSRKPVRALGYREKVILKKKKRIKKNKRMKS